jgi:hypothetical protein
MKILIEVNLDNDAFKENPSELSEVLNRRDWTGLVLGSTGKLRDSNGNTVGQFDVVEDF